MSKAFALAGARLGALLGAPELVALAKRVIPPYALTQPTIEAALRALQPDEVRESRARIELLLNERDRLRRGLEASPLVSKVWHSDANFFDDRLQRRPRIHAAKHGGRPHRPRSPRLSGAAEFTTRLGRHRGAKRCPVERGVLAVSGRRVVFVDRDGTLIEEPPDEQVDSVAKIRLMPGVIAALQSLRQAGFALVMVTNQDGLGTASLPLEAFDTAQQFVLDLFHSQGIDFEAVFVCPHFKTDQCGCRKPKTGLVDAFFAANAVDRGRSYMVGDRETDLQFASNLSITGLRVVLNGEQTETWPSIAAGIRGAARRAAVHRKTKETTVDVIVDLSREGPSVVTTGLGFFDHMLEQIAKHGGFALELRCRGDLHIDEHHTIEDCALALGTALREALGDKLGIARFGFLLAMDEAEAQVAVDLSGRAFLRVGGKVQPRAGGRIAHRIGFAFFSLSGGDLGRGAAHQRTRRKYPSHDRILLQRRGPNSAAGHSHRGQ